ncbi:MAG: maleylpyruvate isomerase N-terminal domain-containing protein [Dermatophilus congolensis]|nr:maleylpyruvate isomerase N-terminal domain-containing protein [Dermatophilus congolensis]
MDARRSYLDTTDAVTELVSRVRPEQLDGPGLGTWNLRALIGHTSRAMSTVVTYLNQPVDKVTCADAVAYYVWVAQGPDVNAEIARRGVEAGQALTDHGEVFAGFAAQGKAVREALAAVPADSDPTIRTLAGGMYLSEYLPTRTFELIVHGFDIAKAAGIAFAPHPGAVAETAALAARVGCALGHADVLLPALTGREQWHGRSVFASA